MAELTNAPYRDELAAARHRVERLEHELAEFKRPTLQQLDATIEALRASRLRLHFVGSATSRLVLAAVGATPLALALIEALLTGTPLTTPAGLAPVLGFALLAVAVAAGAYFLPVLTYGRRQHVARNLAEVLQRRERLRPTTPRARAASPARGSPRLAPDVPIEMRRVRFDPSHAATTVDPIDARFDSHPDLSEDSECEAPRPKVDSAPR